MKTRTISMREKIIASAASAALAASMVVCVPGMAFASIDPTASSIAVTTTSDINVAAGVQVDMSTYFKANAVSSDGLYHVDYQITDGSGATINKHSGLLTTTEKGTVTVTAYLTGIAKPQQNKNNPCEPTTVSNSVTVSIGDAVYGYQGAKNSIKMVSPAVEAFGGNSTSGWTNTLAASTPADGYYSFKIEMSNGFKTYNTALKFADRNAGNVLVTDGDIEDASGVLNSSNTGSVIIDSVDVDSKTVVVKVAAAEVTPGETKLVFTGDFRANNDANTLGKSVSFVIKSIAKLPDGTGSDSGTGADKVTVGSTVKVSGVTYKVSAKGKVVIKVVSKSAKGKKTVTIPTTVKIDGKTYKVAGINTGVFKGSKATTLVIKSKDLTKKGIKNSLKGSKVKTVKIAVSGKKSVNKSYASKYKKFFTKGNCGKSVSLKAA